MRMLMNACAALLVMSATAGAAEMTATQQKLVDMETAWSKAIVAKDAAAISGMVADDWSGQNPSGKMQDKAGMLAEIKSGASTATDMNNHDVKARVIGVMAIVQGADDEKSSYKGKDTSGAYTWTDIFEKRGGKWVAVASQVTKTMPL